MNMYALRNLYDQTLRESLESDAAEDMRDINLNNAWRTLSDMLKINALKRTINFDSVADQATYTLPLDYGGTEVYLYFKNSSDGNYYRLDPVTEDVLALNYEYRGSNKGRVEFYDIVECKGSDDALRACTLTNGSTTVACATAAAGDEDKWCRFDPWTTGDVTTDPGDYAYRITAVTAGVSLTLDRAYRGPAGTTNVRIGPAEQPQVRVYGIPASAITDAFQFHYYAVPRKMYNDSDVPEWPLAGHAIVNMAISLHFEFLQRFDASKVWWGRALGKVQNLTSRQNDNKTLVHDLTIGSVVGRKTGIRGIMSIR